MILNPGKTLALLAYSNNKQTGGLRIYFSENSPGNFTFVTLPLELPEETNLHLWKFCAKLCDTS